jgi:SAM-dependent methyltransferase
VPNPVSVRAAGRFVAADEARPDWQAPRALQELGARPETQGEAAWEWIQRLQDAQSAEWDSAPRQRGAVATPWPIAQRMAERLLAGWPGTTPIRLLDAGCGSGRLMALAARQAARQHLQIDCEGVEIDAAAARWAQALRPLVGAGAGAALRGWRVRRVDFALAGAGDVGFDAAIANPPYVPLRGLDAAYRSRLRAAGAGGSGDLAALFVRRMLASLRPGGRLCVIVPNKLLAASYAAPLRAALLEDNRLDEIWDLSAEAVFRRHGAYPVVLVATRTPAPAGHRIRVRDAAGGTRADWPQADLARLPDHLLPLGMPPEALALVLRLLAGARLGDAVPVGCGIAASGFGRAVGDGPERIIRSGNVRPYRVQGAPRFSPQRAGIAAAALQRQRRPKVVVPGMFRRLCAAWDGEGRLLGRVYFVPVDEGDARRRAARRALLLALLNSRLYAVLYAGLFAAVAQSGGYTRLNAPYLRRLPWPDAEPGAELVALVHRQERRAGPAVQARLDARIEALFGLSADERRLLTRLDQALRGQDDIGPMARPTRPLAGPSRRRNRLP